MDKFKIKLNPFATGDTYMRQLFHCLQFFIYLIFIRYTYQDNKKLYKYSQIMYRKGTTEKVIKMLPSLG